MRDKRDPQKLGEKIRSIRNVIPAGSLSVALDSIGEIPAPDYRSRFMSSDPAFHHSKVKQDVPVEDDGGAE